MRVTTLVLARALVGAITLVLAPLASGACSGDEEAGDGPADLGAPDAGAPDMRAPLPPFCAPPAPPPEALAPPGAGLFIGGRTRAPAGDELPLGGFPVQAIAHPALPVVYVANTGYRRRSLQALAVDPAAPERLRLAQEVTRREAFYGLAISADGARLYASAGFGGRVERYAVDPADGTLTPDGELAIDGYPAGLALSPDGRTLWVARFRALEDNLVEVDAATLSVRGRATLPFEPYALAFHAARGEVWATGFRDRRVTSVAAATRAVAPAIDVGPNPCELEVLPDGRVAVSVSDGDAVVAVDPETRAVALRRALGEPRPGAEEAARRAVSASGLALDASAGRLWVTRALDNGVTALALPDLTPAGTVPTDWYPTDVAVTRGRAPALVVTNGKGLGTGPLLAYGFGAESGKEQMNGTATAVALGELDLAAQTAAFERGLARPGSVYPFDCDGAFPVPDSPGEPTPIEHVVLIVRENKTYDSVLGDLETGDGEPSLALYGEDVVPNLRALARRFTNHDNFYADIETSVQGHLWLVNGQVDDYIERTWFEDYRNRPGWGMDAVGPGRVDAGSFFVHLLRHGVRFRIFGEVVATPGEWDGEPVARSIDRGFPGIFYNLDIRDEEKARYVARRLLTVDFPPFVYVLLPNDHTNGLRPTALTPEAMINDNDYATGILVEEISKSPYWERTAIFITQDDTQIGADHVDYHRTVLVVASPWAKRAHVSSVHTSFPSLFATFERILGVPPMNRLDANAVPLYDAFTNVPDLAPFTAIPRTIPDRTNDGRRVASGPLPARVGLAGDAARGPDRDPTLGRRLWEARRASPYPGPPFTAPEAHAPLDDEEGDAHDAAMAEWARWAELHPDPTPW
jgi:DNA-binding beta-propeller fold protein YncE